MRCHLVCTSIWVWSIYLVWRELLFLLLLFIYTMSSFRVSFACELREMESWETLGSGSPSPLQPSFTSDILTPIYSVKTMTHRVTKQSGAKIEISLFPKPVSQSTNNTMCQLSTEWGSGDAEAKITVIVKEQLLFHEVTWMTARETQWEETENWHIIDIFSKIFKNTLKAWESAS